MTICVAAIGTFTKSGEEKESIVFATDHMVTHSSVGQFEHAIEKFKKLDNNTIVMLAGNFLLFDGVLNGFDVSGLDYFGTCKKLYEKMLAVKFQKIQKEVLNPINLDVASITEILKSQQPIQNPYIMEILNTFLKHNLQSPLLFIGFGSVETLT